LMDIRMPLMSGCSAISELRREPDFAQLPIIALSANALPSERERLLEVGATDFVTKPFMKDELYRKIMQALNLPLRTREPLSAALTPKPTRPATLDTDLAPQKPEDPQEPAPPRILVVDDSNANQQLLSSQLKALGLSAEVAS